MKIVLCSAFKKEISYFLRYYQPKMMLLYKDKYPVYEFKHHQSSIYFIITGMGYKKMFDHLNGIIKSLNFSQESVWILTGYAGALKESLKVGDMIIPKVVRSVDKEYQIHVEKYFPTQRTHTLFCVNKILNKKEKLKLKASYPEMDAIEMEGLAFCEAMTLHQIKNFFIVKAISDNFSFVLPDYKLIKETIFKVNLMDLVKNIGQIKNFILLYYNMNKASKKLFHFFQQWYESQSHKN